MFPVAGQRSPAGRDEEGLFLVRALYAVDLPEAKTIFEVSALNPSQVHREFMKRWDGRTEIDIKSSSARPFAEYKLLLDLPPAGD